MISTSSSERGRQKVLLVDTLSSGNDFGVELPIAIDPLVDLTVFTIKGTRLRTGDCARIIEAFPEYWGSRNKLQKLVDQVRATVRLAVELLRHRNGVVHVQFFRSPAFEIPLYLLLRPFLSRLVYTSHNALPHELKFWHPLAFKLWYLIIDRVHVLSRHTGELLSHKFGIPGSNIVYAPHGSYGRFLRDHPPRAAAATRSRLKLDPDEKIVLYFGLIRPYKGVDRLIDATSYLVGKKTRVVIAGGCAEPLYGELKNRIAANVSRDQILFLHGFVDNQDLSDYLAVADVVVFPYQHIYQSGAVLLAMTYGKPVIVSDLDGFREYVHHGETGWVVDTKDADAFAASINAVLDNDKLSTRVGDAARNACENEFSWPHVAKIIANQVYRDD